MQVREMPAYLVAAASENPYPQKRAPRKLRDLFKGTLRVALDALIACQRTRGLSGLLRASSNQYQIFLERVLRVDPLLKLSRHLAGESKADGSRSSSVKAMNRIEKTITLCTELLEQENRIAGLSAAVDE